MATTIKPMEYFDASESARISGITPEQLRIVQDFMDIEYPGDQMMAELHVLRACSALEDGDYTIEELLKEAHEGIAKAARRKANIASATFKSGPSQAV